MAVKSGFERECGSGLVAFTACRIDILAKAF